jgi:hypothetical protein
VLLHCCICSFFFRLGGGLPLHKVHFLIFRNPLDVSTTCFAIFRLKIAYSIFLSVPPLPTCDCRPEFHPPMSFVVVLSIKYSGCPLHRSLILILPRGCCFQPRFLMQFLHSWPLKRLFSSVRPFRVLGAMSSFPCLCSPCSLPRATFAQRVVLIPEAANSLRGPQFSWVPIFLTAFFLRHATVARRVIFLPATVNLLLDSQLAWILPFGFWRRPAARFRFLRRFLSPPTGITAASSLGTS